MSATNGTECYSSDVAGTYGTARVACGMCRIVSARFCGRGLLEDLGCGRGQCGRGDLGAAVIVRAGTQVGKGRERMKGW